MRTIRYVDLFCGIGGFRIAIEQLSEELLFNAQCVFSSDIDKEARKTYFENFREQPEGDIKKIVAQDIPDHDILFAGFPCQPFSIIGKMNGFEDTRGTLFFDIARILKEKKPQAFVLENVKLLKGHNKGKTLRVILEVLHNLGYFVQYKVLNALSFGLPQKRERIIIIGSSDNISYNWPNKYIPMQSLEELLEENPPPKYYVSEHIRKKRQESGVNPKHDLTIWHENKGGHISAYPFSCALRAGASYNYLLVNGERRLTPREMLRLQGFPDSYKIVCNDSQTRKQAGNAVPIPMVKSAIKNLLYALDNNFSFSPVKKSSGYVVSLQ